MAQQSCLKHNVSFILDVVLRKVYSHTLKIFNLELKKAMKKRTTNIACLILEVTKSMQESNEPCGSDL